MEDSIRTLLIQVVKEPYLEALKAEYMGYWGRMLFNMIEHLQTKRSKATNKDKVQLKKRCESHGSNHIEKTKKQLMKWNRNVLDNTLWSMLWTKCTNLIGFLKKQWQPGKKPRTMKEHVLNAKHILKWHTLQGNNTSTQKGNKLSVLTGSLKKNWKCILWHWMWLQQKKPKNTMSTSNNQWSKMQHCWHWYKNNKRKSKN